jgi:hypothetical protein
VSSPTPDQLVDVSEDCVAVLAGHVGADWEQRAGEIDWSCRHTLEHLACLAFAQQLTMRATAFRPAALSVLPTASIEDLLWTVRVANHVLADVARAAPAEARAFHPAGMADASGWVAMGIDELLVHTYDICCGLEIEFDVPPAACETVLDRLFPWWPRASEPWPALLWANGRRSRGDLPNPRAGWLWYCAPLDEWDGVVPRWDPVQLRRAPP